MSGARSVGVAVAAPFILAVISFIAWRAGSRIWDMGQQLWRRAIEATTPEHAAKLPPLRLPETEDAE